MYFVVLSYRGYVDKLASDFVIQFYTKGRLQERNLGNNLGKTKFDASQDKRIK